MKKVTFYTLGCKLNQAETASISESFINNEYEIVSFGEKCDICVINTCTVTAKTDYRCRQIIRKAIKISPDAVIVVVGCYAQIAIDELKEMPGVDIVLGSDKKFEIHKYLNANEKIQLQADNKNYVNTNVGIYKERTRAFLKIQDGCNNFCSYCIVPYARGKSRSSSLEEIESNISELIQRDFKEIVITGVHIGTYGQDLTQQSSLLDALKTICKIPNIGRIRLSSLEPLEISDELIEFIACSSKICKHLHIPLQNGDDFILNKMNRNYSIKQYANLLTKLVQYMPDIGLGTDIIVGFPGEQEQHFENTFNLIKELPFTYLHVFSFSARQGTEAYLFPDRVLPEHKKIRSKKLIALGKEKKHNFYNEAINRQYKVLFEENKNNDDWMYGFTDNYIRVKVKKDINFLNQITRVAIKSIEDQVAIGEIIT